MRPLFMSAVLTGLAWMLGLMLAASLSGCAQIKKEPMVHPLPVTQPQPPAPPPKASAGSLYRPGSAHALFEDRRPSQVGDTITVVLAETVNATKSSGASVSRSSKAGVDLGAMPKFLSGLIGSAQNVKVGGDQSMTAGGGANASNAFNGVITVTVAEVLANGNFVVSGEKQMLINQGTEYIRFSGVVNPRSLSAGHSVMSAQVADARIEYSAKGFIDEAQTMGWLQRFFINVLPM
jgi:flagellar L-ring protein precursor FlgH